jgi:uncharacterized protein with von Willebrand factor type A (vWA) domain
MSDDDFLVRLVRFGRALQSAGLEVGPGRLRDAIVALTGVDATSHDDVYWALRCTLCSHHDHLEVFDAAFESFWRGGSAAIHDRRRLHLEPAAEEDERSEGSGCDPGQMVETGSGTEVPESEDPEHGQGASSTERLLKLDFREYGPDELVSARRLVDRIAKMLPRRSSFRLEPARSAPRPDMRRTLRQAMRTEGDPMQRAWRRNRLVPRRTVFLLDISGSMAPYGRPLLMFAQSAVQAGRSVEVFTFGTRLTRITHELVGTDRDRALAEAAKTVPDWSGGTRIGPSVKCFNENWGRRGMARGAVAVIVSDGWERGDPAPLQAAIAQLHRIAHAVVWVNPLAGDPDYAPLAAGMAAALPHIDLFLPGHDLSALMSLAAALEHLPDRRGHVHRHAGVTHLARASR